MRLALLTVLFAIAFALPSAAAENGVITGVVVNETTGRPAKGTEVRLAGADEDGSGRVNRTITTSGDGTYRFDNLPAEPDWLYIVDASYEGGLFPGSAFGFPESQPPRLETTLRVWDTTPDPESVLIARDAMFVLPADNAVEIVESVTVLNHTDLAYIGRGGASGEAETTFGFGLPSGAENVRIANASIDIPELKPTDFGFGVTVALPPGESRFTYTYRVPADGLTYILSKTALYPTADLLVFVGEPLAMESDRLQEEETVTVDGKEYRRWAAAETVEAGDTVLLQATAEAQIGWVPLVAVGAGIVVVLAATYLLLVRRRSPRGAAPPTRNEIIDSIAALDIDYEAGKIDETRWHSERENLKRRLREEGHPS